MTVRREDVARVNLGQENTLGRHYSRFRPILRIAHKQYQSLAQSRNGKNRPRGFESANFG
jgi:hypothetical protein